MIAEAIKQVLENSPSEPRPTLLTVEDELGTRQFLFNDAKKAYDQITRRTVQSESVSNIESFAKLVKEEARRRSNPTGDWMTVVFSATGAKFGADDRERWDSSTYTRKHHPLWKVLLDSLNKPLEHLELIRIIQQLRPAVRDYANLIRNFKKVSIDSKTAVSSAPVLTEGKAGHSYSFSIEAKGGTIETTLPSDFVLDLPFVRATDRTYPVPVEINAELGSDRRIRFALVAPDLGNVQEQAIADEVAYFREQTKEMTDLLTLIDY